MSENSLEMIKDLENMLVAQRWIEDPAESWPEFDTAQQLADMLWAVLPEGEMEVAIGPAGDVVQARLTEGSLGLLVYKSAAAETYRPTAAAYVAVKAFLAALQSSESKP